jgi:hypothetical protein
MRRRTPNRREGKRRRSNYCTVRATTGRELVVCIILYRMLMWDLFVAEQGTSHMTDVVGALNVNQDCSR